MDSLDKHFRQITRPAFERYGFAHAELVAQWAEVVGEDLAARCSPERMSWPKGRPAGQRHAEGATLTVKCDHGAGLALSYETARIADRVNAFYGYRPYRPSRWCRPTAPDPGAKLKSRCHRLRMLSTRSPVASVKSSNPICKAALTRLGEAALTKAAKPRR